MIHQTEAIVLNHHKYGNSSVICNLFTSKYGKINIIAKGARRLKNTHSAVLQPCNNIDLVFFSKKTRKVQTLKEASIITSFISINKDAAVTICFVLPALSKKRIGLKKIPPPIPTTPETKPRIPPIKIEVKIGIFLKVILLSP